MQVAECSHFFSSSKLSELACYCLLIEIIMVAFYLWHAGSKDARIKEQ